MATYAVGDIQGCYEPLRRLMDAVDFDPARDQLWAAGDMVNRGPDSLSVLRYLKQLGSAFRGVLGNHDLHLLAVAHGERAPKSKDTLGAILRAPDRDELTTWLRDLPLAIFDRGYLMVHAGVVPEWTLSDVLSNARLLESTLRSDEAGRYFATMYGNEPVRVSDATERSDRLRVLTNVFTRIRFCSADGRLDLAAKGPADQPPSSMLPWYAHNHRKTKNVPILFGHWASLLGRASDPNVFALDTGCVWGQRLTAFRLEDRRRTECDCTE